jgi:hypothetical protein
MKKITAFLVAAAFAVPLGLTVASIPAKADIEPNKECLREYRDAGGHLIREWTCGLTVSTIGDRSHPIVGKGPDEDNCPPKAPTPR